ncbi:MAG: trypsin-like peptidase domain-containing protein, partial [Planctomycetia bacterium]
HVVENVEEITTQLSDGRSFPGRVVNFDPKADLALVKIDGPDSFAYLPLWGAGPPLLGEIVIAIGNPYGLDNTVTTGIVSAVDRTLKLPNGETFNDLLQTDASINPGNSGGPLLNINGDLLGINVAIRSNAQGIGFAIPTVKVRQIVLEMSGASPISLVGHGLHLEEVDPATFVKVAAAVQPGVGDEPAKIVPIDAPSNPQPTMRVVNVDADSAASKAGFRKGDELVAVGKQPVRVQFDLQRILWAHKFGDTLVVQVRRAGAVAADTTFLNLPISAARELSDAEVLWQKLGLRVGKLPVERVKPVYDKLNGGLLLLDVQPGSPFAAAGLQPGDILIGIHEWETIDANNVRFVMQWDQREKNQPLKFHAIRRGALINGTVQLPGNP